MAQLCFFPGSTGSHVLSRRLKSDLAWWVSWRSHSRRYWFLQKVQETCAVVYSSPTPWSVADERGSSCPNGYPLPMCVYAFFCSSWLKPPPAGVEHSNQRGVADSNNLRNNIVQNLKFLVPSSSALIWHKWSLMTRFNALQRCNNRKIRRSWLKLPVFLYLTLEFVRNTQLFLYVDILSAMLTMWWEEAMYNVFIYHLDLFK